MRQQTISIKFSEEKVFVRWCDGVGREGEEELPLAGRLQWTGIPRVQFPPFSALYFSSPHTSEQSELCKWALLQNAQLEQLGMDSSFQITRASRNHWMNSFVFFYSLWHGQEKEVMGHELWKFLLNTLPLLGCRQLQQ